VIRHKYFIEVTILQIFLDFDVERFNPKKLSGVEVGEQFQIKISNRFAALERLEKTLTRMSKSQLKRV
jgi:hypothetical protein